jgi:hypothetical protein
LVDDIKYAIRKAMTMHRAVVVVAILWGTFRVVVASSGGDECILQVDGTCSPPLPEATWIPVRVTEDDAHYLEIAALGLRQSVENGYTAAIEERVQKVVDYMKGMTAGAPECQLRNELCTYWAVVEECEKNPGRFASGSPVPMNSISYIFEFLRCALQATCK